MRVLAMLHCQAQQVLSLEFPGAQGSPTVRLQRVEGLLVMIPKRPLPVLVTLEAPKHTLVS